MTRELVGGELQAAVEAFAPGATAGFTDDSVRVDASRWLEVATELRDRDEFKFEMLTLLTAVDYIEYFEIVYQLRSLTHNTSAVVKVQCGQGRTPPEAPSVVGVWKGSDFQEREAFDLMGIRFDSHPNLKRIMLWESFPGHPLRKDFLR
jgi:NADH-quinone oxidoreductase subunit C